MVDETTPSASKASDLETKLQTAVGLHAAGNLAAAEQHYRDVLKIDPDQPVALNLLGVIAHQMSQHEAAVQLISKAVAVKPGYAEAHYNLGLALAALGRFDQALTKFQRAAELEPGYADAHFHAANSLCHLDQPEAAIAAFGRALALKPDFASAHCGLGNLLMALRRFEDAIDSYRKAIDLKPDYAEALFNMGNCLKAAGRFGDAATAYEKALDVLPDHAGSHNNLASVLKELGDIERAIEHYQRAIAVEPDYADAHFNLGNLLADHGKTDQAIASYTSALTINPQFSDAHYNLGRTLEDQGKLDQATASYRAAIAHDPRSADAHFNLGNMLRETGHIDDAAVHFRAALELEPQSLRFALDAWLLSPIIMTSHEEIEKWRAYDEKGLQSLETSPDKLVWHGEELNFDRFYLAYHDRNNRPMNARLSDALRRHIDRLTWQAPHLQAWQPPGRTGRRIRLGILSRYLRHQHTIGKLYKGLLQQLDSRRFEIVVIHAPGPANRGFEDMIDDLSERSITLAPGLEDQQRAVAEAQPDVLFFPDIGMDPSTYLLAHARLAPVQAVAWGHPDTTGISSLDYFISADAIEPEEARDHYREQLIRLSRLPCFYTQPNEPPAATHREDFGLPASGTLYGCPQSLYKLHPDFDAILSDIVKGDPDGWIVLIEGRVPAWADLLRRRWRKSVPHIEDRVLFLPFMPLARFLALQSHIDVLLDPVHFGAGNTMYEAMAIGTPIVTWPGRFMRSRIVAAAYAQMGIDDAPVAGHLDDYATLALELGRDPQRRRQLATRIVEAARQHLFSDAQVVREFEAFFEAAVEAAGRGQRLPADWQPPPGET